MKKLKDILLEGYAWERKPGQPLPTLAEVQAEYLRNEADKPDFLDLDNDGNEEESMKLAARQADQANPLEAEIAKLEKEIADLKHQYYSVSNLSSEREKQLRGLLGEKGRKLKSLNRKKRTGDSGYKKKSKEPMKQAADQRDDVNEYGDDKTHSVHVSETGVEPYDAAYDKPKDAMTESFWKRVNGNLHGHEYILREAFRK